MRSRSTKKEVSVARASSTLLLFLRLQVLFLFFRRRFAVFRLDGSLGSLFRLLRQLPRFALSLHPNSFLSSNSQRSLCFTIEKKRPLTIAATSPSSAAAAAAAEDVTSLFRRLRFFSSTFSSPSTSIASASPSAAATSGFSSSPAAPP